MLSKSSKWELGLVHYIVKFTKSRFKSIMLSKCKIWTWISFEVALQIFWQYPNHRDTTFDILNTNVPRYSTHSLSARWVNIPKSKNMGHHIPSGFTFLRMLVNFQSAKYVCVYTLGPNIKALHWRAEVHQDINIKNLFFH